MSGKAPVNQVAQRYGVLPETVQGWRDTALEAVSESMRLGLGGPGKSSRERELERELTDARHAVTESAIQVALLQKVIKQWGVLPSPRGP